jgi:DNA repair exonuclease SbcCD ATPase subunit
MSEGSKPGEGQTLEELQSQIAALTSTLEDEKKSKERILEESKKYKEGYQSFKSEKEKLASQKAKEEEDRLIKEGQFKTLLEQREDQLSKLQESLNSMETEVKSRDTAITNFKKAAAFERAIGGKMKKDAYWNHVDFDSIATNPETGAIDASSLQKVANDFTEEYKELVDYGNNANLPNGAPKGTGKLTYEQWQKLPLAEKRKRMNEVQD